MKMTLEDQVKDVGQAVVAGTLPAASYLSDLSLWVTIGAGIASFVYLCSSLFKMYFPERFAAFVKKLNQKK